MPSDDSTVATQADFVPMAVGNTDRVRSVVSVSAHDGFSHHLRSGVQQGFKAPRRPVLTSEPPITRQWSHGYPTTGIHTGTDSSIGALARGCFSQRPR